MKGQLESWLVDGATVLVCFVFVYLAFTAYYRTQPAPVIAVGLSSSDIPVAAVVDSELRLVDGRTGSDIVNIDRIRPTFSVAISHDLRLVATSGIGRRNTGLVQVWNAADGRLIRTMGNPGQLTTGIAFSSDAALLAWAGYGTGAHVWTVETGEEIFTLPNEDGNGPSSVAFSPQRRTLAVGTFAGTIRLFDPTTGTEFPVLRGDRDRVLCLSFSSDGKILASGDYRGTLVLWDMASAKPVFAKRFRSPIFAVALAAHGTVIAVPESETKTKQGCAIHLWDTTTGKQLAALRGHDGPIYGLVFSADGTLLYSGGADGTIRTWDVRMAMERFKIQLERATPQWVFAAAFAAGLVAASARRACSHHWRRRR